MVAGDSLNFVKLVWPYFCRVLDVYIAKHEICLWASFLRTLLLYTAGVPWYCWYLSHTVPIVRTADLERFKGLTDWQRRWVQTCTSIDRPDWKLPFRLETKDCTRRALSSSRRASMNDTWREKVLHQVQWLNLIFTQTYHGGSFLRLQFEADHRQSMRV